MERGNQKICKLGKLSSEVFEKFPCRYKGSHEYVKRNPLYNNKEYCKYLIQKSKIGNLKYDPIDVMCTNFIAKTK